MLYNIMMWTYCIKLYLLIVLCNQLFPLYMKYNMYKCSLINKYQI